jgi:hypothetical protein
MLQGCVLSRGTPCRSSTTDILETAVHVTHCDACQLLLLDLIEVTGDPCLRGAIVMLMYHIFFSIVPMRRVSAQLMCADCKVPDRQFLKR